MLGISLVFPSDIITIEFGEVDTENQVVPISYDSPDVITGFHLFITGMDINIEWLLAAAQKTAEDNKKKLDKKHEQ